MVVLDVHLHDVAHGAYQFVVFLVAEFFVEGDGLKMGLFAFEFRVLHPLGCGMREKDAKITAQLIVGDDLIDESVVELDLGYEGFE